MIVYSERDLPPAVGGVNEPVSRPSRGLRDRAPQLANPLFVAVARRRRARRRLPVEVGQQGMGAGPHVARAQPERVPEDAAEMRFAGESQAEGDVVDAAMVVRRIG